MRDAAHPRSAPARNPGPLPLVVSSLRALGGVVGAGAVMALLAPATAGAAAPAPCDRVACVASPRWDTAFGRGISVANTPFEVASFAGPSGEDPQGRVFLGGVYDNSTGVLTCGRIRGRVAVGGFRIVASDNPTRLGTGVLVFGVDNGRTPPGRAVDRGNAVFVDAPPTACPEPDPAKATFDLCGELTIRDARPGGPALVPRLPVKAPAGRPCGGTAPGIVVATPTPGARVRVPALVGRRRSAALCTLARFGLRWRFRGSPRVYDLATGCDGRSRVSPDPTVSEQSPRAQTWVRSGHVMVLDDECALAARRGGSRRCL